MRMSLMVLLKRCGAGSNLIQVDTDVALPAWQYLLAIGRTY